MRAALPPARSTVRPAVVRPPARRRDAPRAARLALALVPAFVMLLLAPAGTAAAHGEQGHAPAPPASAATVREQQPWGVAGQARAVRRSVEITMGDDMRFRPDRLEVRQGETLRLRIRNEGAMLHEFVLGTRQELDAHAALMLRLPDMQHDAPWMAHVPPGEVREIVWRFNRAGEFEFACLIAGHYQAGMVGRVRVVPRR